jgi:hypothetical protein
VAASDFTFTVLSKEEVEHFDSQRAQGLSLCSKSTREKLCYEPVRFVWAYTFESSKTQRRAISKWYLCEQHARELAEKTNVELPAGAQP